MVCVVLLSGGAAWGQQQDPPPLPTPPSPPPSTQRERVYDVNGPVEQGETERQRKPEPLPLDALRLSGQPDPNATAEGQRRNTPQDQRDRVYFTAETVDGDDATGIVVATGNVRVRYNGYIVTSDRATLDRRRNVVTFESNVTLTTNRQTVFADFVSVNTRTNEFTSRGGRTIVPPDLIGQQITQPLYLSGAALTRVGNVYEAENGLLTTCDFPNPHYKIGFRKATLIPNNRIVLRDAVIYRYDRKLVRIPYLVLPIRDEIRYSYLPFIGRTNEEGWFFKAVLGYSLSRTLPGLLRVDLMEKKGVGLGFDQAYRFGDRSAGTFALYNLQDKNRGVANRNTRLNHQQLIGDVSVTVANDAQNNSYQSLTPSSQTSQTNVTVSRAAGGRSTNVTLSQSISKYDTSDSTNTAYSVSQTEQIGRNGSVTFRFNASDQDSRNTFNSQTTRTGRQEQTGDLQATLKAGVFDVNLAANRNFLLRQKGVSGSGFAFSGTQRLPDVTLATDTGRLGGLLARLPMRVTFGYGRFLENVTAQSAGTTTGGLTTRAVTTNRLLFDLTPEQKRVNVTPGGWLSLNLDGNFRQTVYGADAAQYVLTGRGALTQRLATDSNLNFTYNYLRPYGGFPTDFRLDQSGSTNNVGANLTVNTYRTKLSLLTGYDILRANADLGQNIPKNPWQNLSLQLAFRPSDLIQTRFTTTYDINGGRLLDATNRFRYRDRRNYGFDIGLRFDPRTGKFPQITEAFTLPLFSQDLVLTTIASYNGITKKFDYRQLTLVQSFHDYDLVFGYIDQPYGFRTERGFNLSIRLRAFPTVRTQPAGQFGTPIDTGSGDIF